MRRITPFISASTARALLVSALILAGGSLSSARAANTRDLPPGPEPVGDETAFAEARSSLGGDGVVSLPHPLTATVASLYKLIFAAQRRGDFRTVQDQMRLLSDSVLFPDLLADRYLAQDAHPSVEQLRDWLHLYPTQPDAVAIQALLQKLAVPGSVPNQTFIRPLAPYERPSETKTGDARSTPAPVDPVLHAFIRNPLLDRTVQERVAQGVKGRRVPRTLWT